MSEQGFAMLALAFTGKKAVALRLQFVKAFAAATKRIKELERKQADPAWLDARRDTKLGHALIGFALETSRKLAGKEGGGIHGTIIGLDMLPMAPVADVHFILGDFREQSVLQELEVAVGGRKLDLVLSDMAPNLTGIGATDAARVEDIIDLALDFAGVHLKPSGCLLVKCFNGSGYSQIVEKFRQTFKTVTSKKPKASRDKSSEIFLLGRGLRNPG